MALFGLSSRLTRLARMRRELDNMKRAQDVEPFSWEWEVRRDRYAEWEKLYANTAYLKQADGGLREVILADTFGRTEDGLPLHGFYSPAKTIVEAYQNVFHGRFGKGIEVAPEFDGRPVAPALVEGVRGVWKVSNLDTAKALLCRYAALYGSVGLRVVARAPDGARPGKVRLVIEPPARIKDYNEDAEGNVTEVLLEYTMLDGPLGEERQDVNVNERLGKDGYQVWRDDVLVEEGPNDLGVCPYVLLRHYDLGGEYGVPAFYGSEPAIHCVNWLMSRQDMSIHRHVYPQWFASGASEEPESFDLGELKVIYAKVIAGDPAPSLQPLVAQLDHASAIAFWSAVIDLLRERQPELILGSVKALAGQSGETIAKLMKPAEQAILNARGNYEDALGRALKIAVSWRVLLGMTDLGTGTGTREAADAAFHGGKEDFDFAERPAVAPDPFERIKAEEAETARRRLDFADAATAAAFASSGEQLRIAGYSPKDVEKILRERAEVDVIPEVEQ